MRGLNATRDKDEREAARLTAIEMLGAARSEVDGALQELVDQVREAFGTDLCMVNLVLSDVQYFRAWSGDLPRDLAEARQDPRERSMCRYVVESEEPLVVPDFLATEEFGDQHFRVRYGIRFYAGTPLITSDGYAIGSLCLLDTRPREDVGEDDLALLRAFGRAVVGRLELLGALKREEEAKEEEARRSRELERLGRQREQILNCAGEGVFGLDSRGNLQFVNPAAVAMLGYEPEELIGRHQHTVVHHSYPDGSPYPTEECPIYAVLRNGKVRRSAGEVFWRKDARASRSSSPVPQ